MPVKILLADKSITIQKVVEMLFSGKDYEVLCVSDGETALAEAERAVPDVVLADIDLPRVDGYTFSARLKQTAALAQTPVILMMSRDDVFDANKARQGTIVDHIAKPFESQDLIGKVKKAVSAAPPRLSEPTPAAPRPAVKPAAPSPAPAAARPAQAAPVTPPAPPATAAPAKPAAKPKSAPAPSDIFDIIQEAPSQADLKRSAPAPAEEEGIYEVEPEIEVEEQLVKEVERALPVGEKAVEEMRAGLGLGEKKAAPKAPAAAPPSEPDIVSFESLDMATQESREYAPPEEQITEEELFAPAREAREYVPPPVEREAREYVPPPEPEVPAGVPEARLRAIAEEAVAQATEKILSRVQPPAVPEKELRRLAEEVFARKAKEYLGAQPPAKAPEVSEEAIKLAIEENVTRVVRQVAREVIEKVAWEVVPDLAEMLIKAEIERMKQET